jgi:hypothetical protein
VTRAFQSFLFSPGVIGCGRIEASTKKIIKKTKDIFLINFLYVLFQKEEAHLFVSSNKSKESSNTKKIIIQLSKKIF